MRKRFFKSIVIVSFALLTFCSLPAFAEDESPVSASADVSILSQYVWRGYALSDDNMVIQPSVTVSYNGFSFNLWGNLDTDDPVDNDTSLNETDMTLSYDWSFDKFSIGAGYLYYALEGEDTQEVYLTFGLNTLLSPTLSVYKDIDTVPGWYYNLGISHSITFTDALALDLGASMGYMDTEGYDELHDGAISASMTFAVNDYISITPEASYTFALTDESKDNIRDGSWDNDENHFYGGVTCSLAF
jgi:uncharacterized protein (TIGR02001 family)